MLLQGISEHLYLLRHSFSNISIIEYYFCELSFMFERFFWADMKHLEFVSLPREKLQVKDDASSFSEQNINSKEARTEDAVDQKRRNTKRRDTQ